MEDRQKRQLFETQDKFDNSYLQVPTHNINNLSEKCPQITESQQYLQKNEDNLNIYKAINELPMKCDIKEKSFTQNSIERSKMIVSTNFKRKVWDFIFLRFCGISFYIMMSFVLFFRRQNQLYETQAKEWIEITIFYFIYKIIFITSILLFNFTEKNRTLMCTKIGEYRTFEQNQTSEQVFQEQSSHYRRIILNKISDDIYKFVYERNKYLKFFDFVNNLLNIFLVISGIIRIIISQDERLSYDQISFFFSITILLADEKGGLVIILLPLSKFIFSLFLMLILFFKVIIGFLFFVFFQFLKIWFKRRKTNQVENGDLNDQGQVLLASP